MKTTFCGHAKYIFSEKEIQLFKNLLLEHVEKYPCCEFFLGNYGNFDRLAFLLLSKIKESFPNIKLIFVTPYIDENYSKLKNAKEIFDEIIYPPLEKVPKRFAISKRNEWMIDNSNYLFAFVKATYGGAYKSLEYAKRKNIPFTNVATIE